MASRRHTKRGINKQMDGKPQEQSKKRLFSFGLELDSSKYNARLP